MRGRHPGPARAGLVALVALVLAAGAGFSTADEASGGRASMGELVDAGLVEAALGDEAFLEEEGYLADEGTVPVIVELDERVPREAAQAGIADAMEEANASFAPGLELAFTHSLAAEVEHGAIPALVATGVVEKVWLDWQGELTLQDSAPLINATEAWTHEADTSEGSLNDENLTGAGVNVSIIDSGLAYDHVEFGACEPPINYSVCERVTTGWDYIDEDEDPYDEDDHGTHVSGIVGAEGVNLQGVANRTTFIVYRACDSSAGSCSMSDVADAVENSTEQGAEVVSISLGFQCHACSDGSDIVSQTVDDAAAEGVAVAAAAGNHGENGITSPGTAEGAITVGATTKSDVIWSKSSRGPTGDDRTKPDVVAPGVDINSTARPLEIAPERYEEKSGTSMSAPHVTGTVALMLQADPGLSPSEVKDKLRNSTVIPEDMEQHLDGERGPDTEEYAYGWGRVDALRALDQGAPTTRLTLDGEQGEAGWFTGPVTATFTTSDEPDALEIHTGPRELYVYHDDEPAGETVTLNGVGPDETLTGEVMIGEDGVHALAAHGVDNGGNVAANASWTVKLDQVPPASERSLSPEGNATEVALSAEDATSGVERTQYRVDDSDWQVYEGPFVAEQGAEVAYRSVDAAGNVEAEHVFDVPRVTYASPGQGNATVQTPAGSLEQPLPEPARELTRGAAVTAGTVTFELAIGTQHSNVTTATITVVDEAGAVVDVVELAYDRTREDGRHVWTATWEPPVERALERLTAETDVENADGAHAKAQIDLVTVGPPSLQA